MPRRSYKRQQADKDPVYDSFEIAKLINYVMVDGKKTISRKIVYNVLEMMTEKKLDPVNVVKNAIANTAPNMEVKPRRVGGASYLVPTETRGERRLFLAFNWIIEAAQGRPNSKYHTFDEKLYAEIMDAYENQGGAIEKKRQVEKLAEANKAFAHFKW